MNKLDVNQALNKRKSQNIMSSPSGESKRYIDTNLDHDEKFENKDNMQWTN